MAWEVEDFFGPDRWQQFHLFASGSAIGSSINESISMDKRWKLAEIRLHFSSVMGSVKYFTVNKSAVLGSQYNTQFYSDSLNAVQDLTIRYSYPLLFASDDQLVIDSSVLSVANAYGLEVIGWSIIN